MKKYFCGAIFGILLSLSVTAYADEIGSMIGLKVEGSFPLIVNEQKSEKDAIVIEGTSYIPVRAAGELFGYEVSFIDSKVILNRKEMAVDNTQMINEIMVVLKRDGKIESTQEKAKIIYDEMKSIGKVVIGQTDAEMIVKAYYRWLDLDKEENSKQIKAEQDADEAQRKKILDELAKDEIEYQKAREAERQQAELAK